MPQPLYLGEGAPKYSLNRRLTVPQSWSGHDVEEKIAPVPGIKSQSSSL